MAGGVDEEEEEAEAQAAEQAAADTAAAAEAAEGAKDANGITTSLAKSAQAERGSNGNTTARGSREGTPVAGEGEAGATGEEGGGGGAEEEEDVGPIAKLYLLEDDEKKGLLEHVREEGGPEQLEPGSATSQPNACIGHCCRIYWPDDWTWYDAGESWCRVLGQKR